MEIVKLDICNFLSYRSAVLNLKDRGLLLVEGENRDQGGSNGSGKSTLFTAIEWCLFGKTSLGLRGDEVCNVKQIYNTRVTLELLVAKKEVTIIRYRNSRKHSNKLMLVIDGNDCRASSNKETQKRINTLLGLDHLTFTNVVLFPQEQTGLAAHTEADQKTIFDVLLNIERFRKAKELTKELIAETEGHCAEIYKLVTKTQCQIETDTTQLKEIEDKGVEWDRLKILRCAALEEELAEHTENVPQDPKELKIQKEALSELCTANLEVKTDHTIRKLEYQVSECKAQYASKESEIRVIQHQINNVQFVDVEEYISSISTCPTCKQDLPTDKDAVRCSVLLTHQEQRKWIAVQREHIDKLQREIATLQNSIRDFEAELDKEYTAKEQYIALRAQLTAVDMKLRAQYTAYDQWEVKRDALREQLHEAQVQVSPYIEIATELLAHLQETRRELGRLEKELAPYEDELRYMKFWEQGFGNQGIKSLLLRNITPLLNQRANIYFSAMTNGAGTIKVKTQTPLVTGELREKLAFEAQYNSGSKLYKSKSGGEKRRVNIALLFALGDLAAARARVPVKLSLLDEPFENLDGEGAEQVVSLLKKYIVPRAGTVLVMTHNKDLAQLFENRIKVVKENGFSRLVDA